MQRREKSKNAKAHLAPKQKISYAKKEDPTLAPYTQHALNWLRQAEFLMSAPKLALCVEDSGYEIAFAGRSNAGKSSAINTLTNQKQLARASKRPGRTQMINFFSLGNPHQRLVDLPGYGYAAVPEDMKRVWQKELENYLIHRKSLQGLILLMDIRHPLQHFDLMMLEWAHSRHLFVHILLTKADKLNRGPAHKVLLEVQQTLKKMKMQFSIQLFSSLDRQGLAELAGVMAGRLGFTLNEDGSIHTPLLLDTLNADELADIPIISADDLTEDDLTEDDLSIDNLDTEESDFNDSDLDDLNTDETDIKKNP